jgi:hypothetical protein
MTLSLTRSDIRATDGYRPCRTSRQADVEFCVLVDMPV